MIKELKKSFEVLKKNKLMVLIDSGFLFLVFALIFVFSNLFKNYLGEINNLTGLEDPFAAFSAIQPVVNKLVMFFAVFFIVVFLLYFLIGSLQWRWSYNLIKKKKGKFNKKYFLKFSLVNLIFLGLFYLLYLLLKISRSDLQVLIVSLFYLILIGLLLILYVLLNEKKLLNVFKEIGTIISKVHLFLLMYLIVFVVFIFGLLFMWLIGLIPWVGLGIILDLIVIGIVISLSRIFISLVVEKVF